MSATVWFSIMIKKLRIKFILVTMAATTLVLFSIIGVINMRNYLDIVERADKTLAMLERGDGRFPLEIGEKPSHTGSEDGGRRPDGLSPETPFETRYFMVVLDEAGEVISVNTDKIAAVDRETAEAFAKELYNAGKTKGFKGNYRYLLSAEESQSTIIFLDCTRDRNTFFSFWQASMLISLAGLSLVFVLIVFFSQLATRPVAVTYQKQKRFITDANHELKTPLTVIGANCDLLEMENGENEWTRSIRGQVERLTELTDKLVFLSRMDEENAGAVLTDCSLSEIASNAVRPYTALAASQNKRFEVKIAENITVCGDTTLIRELLTLLLDNAFKYSDEAGDIRFTLAAAGKNKVITLSNTTDGIPQGSMDKLFERFYRLDRSRNSETGGHGIGLSVAKAIVELHRGKITVCSEDGKTIVFTVTLP